MHKAFSPEELNRHQKVLNFTSLAVFVVSTIASLLIVHFDLPISIITTLSMLIVSLVVNAMNRRGHFNAGAVVLCVVMYFSILIITMEGYGLWDVTLIAYPFFIAAGALFFGRKSVKYFVISVVAALVFLNYFQETGHVRTVVVNGPGENLWFLLLIIIGCSLIVWYLIDSLEKSIKRTETSEKSMIATYDHTLAGWVKALEYRDKETEEHSKRVVEMTVRLARAMGVADANIEHYRRGALLHDIGKLTIPDSILLKKSSLTDKEMDVMRRHPLIAGEMLSSIGFLAPAIEIPVYHHEHWDGSGYPYGLKGEQIPFAARLFAVVDSWEALGSQRTYRSAWAQEVIIQYLIDNKGILFDPQVVDAFLPLLDGNKAPKN